MGQYLAIGIATSIYIVKERAHRSCFLTDDEIKEALQKEHNAFGIYDLTEDDYSVNLDLKPEIATEDWIDMIGDFYKLRYGSIKNAYVNMDVIKRGTNLEEWLEISKEHGCQGYQYDTYGWLSTAISSGWSRSLDTNMEMVVLSMDGKILMECYKDLFNFFTQLIRDKLSKYRLANSLKVVISG